MFVGAVFHRGACMEIKCRVDVVVLRVVKIVCERELSMTLVVCRVGCLVTVIEVLVHLNK